MRLLKYEGYNLSFEPEILTLKVFKKLHARDKTKGKTRFLQELGYIYFMTDPRSDYQYIIDSQERSLAIIEGEGLPSDWKVDALLQEAMDYYMSFKSTSVLLLEDTRAMIDGYRIKLRELTSNMTELDIREVKELGAIIKQIPVMVKDLDEAEKAIAKEIMQNDKIRGSAEKSMYEDLNF